MLLSMATDEARPANMICNARDNSARVLRTSSPNDVHPDWARDNRVGTGNAFVAKQRITDEWGFVFLLGDLFSTRGGRLNTGVYILEREWICRPRL